MLSAQVLPAQAAIKLILIFPKWSRCLACADRLGRMQWPVRGLAARYGFDQQVEAMNSGDLVQVFMQNCCEGQVAAGASFRSPVRRNFLSSRWGGGEGLCWFGALKRLLSDSWGVAPKQR